jgi:putative DNA primase/helicase
MIRASDIHGRIRGNWPSLLERLGINAEYLKNRHGPCPACGGENRFRFDNKDDRGGWFCNQCGDDGGGPGAGDGFKLLQRAFGWTFAETRKRVMEAEGIEEDENDTSSTVHTPSPERIPESATPVAMPTARVLRLQRELVTLHECPDAIECFKGRALWPQAAKSSLRAHAGLDYFEGKQSVARYPAIVAAVRDIDGELVTAHVTYLEAGRKLMRYEPRKILSGMRGRQGCAVRLRPTGDTLGIAEGIETALAASLIHGLPVWSALNAGMLAKFTPPAPVKRLVIFADRDEAGLTAADRLTECLKGRISVELRTPPAPAKDWADVLMGAA